MLAIESAPEFSRLAFKWGNLYYYNCAGHGWWPAHLRPGHICTVERAIREQFSRARLPDPAPV
jgi:hypothetical protein